MEDARVWVQGPFRLTVTIEKDGFMADAADPVAAGSGQAGGF